jgi:hypothetical protein
MTHLASINDTVPNRAARPRFGWVANDQEKDLIIHTARQLMPLYPTQADLYLVQESIGLNRDSKKPLGFFKTLTYLASAIRDELRINRLRREKPTVNYFLWIKNVNTPPQFVEQSLKNVDAFAKKELAPQGIDINVQAKAVSDNAVLMRFRETRPQDE